MQAQEIGAFHGLGALGVVGHGGAAFVEGLQSGRIPFGSEIRNLDTDLGRVLHGRVEGVKRQHILTADDDCLVTGAQGNGVDPAVIRLRLGNESHNDNPP